MRWDAVLQAIMSTAAADSVLAAIYGDAIFKTGSQEYVVPGLSVEIVSIPRPGELWQPHTFQFTHRTTTLDDLVDADRALDRLFDHDRGVFIAGVFMYAFYEDGLDSTASPAREGYYEKASRYTFTTVRGKLLPGRS